MINKQELRIGNTVDQGKIRVLNEKTALIGFRLYSYNKLKPIPLTEELLIDRGFEFNTFSEVYEDSTRVSIYMRDNFFFAQIDNILITEIYHLHELENLYYSLTKKELICLKK